MRVIAAILLLTGALAAAPLQGLIRGAGVPLPGAMVTATRGANSFSTVTVADGTFEFANLAPGTWTIRVAMTGFVGIQRSVMIAPVTSATPNKGGPATFTADLRITPAAVLTATGASPAPSRHPGVLPAAGPAALPAGGSRPALAVNGSMNNSAGSRYTQSAAFGNARPKPRSLYNGSFGLALDSSAFDARSFSLTGQDSPKPAYNNLTVSFQIGGPLVIPHVLGARNAPLFFVAYQKGGTRAAATAAALVPTLAERSGDLTALGGPVIPSTALSPQAQALLALFPPPNRAGSQAFNYQVPLVTNQHQDSLQSRLSKSLAGYRLAGSFGFLSTRSDAANLFGFDDGTRLLSLNGNVTVSHSLGPSLYGTFGVKFGRTRTRLTPYFAQRENVAANAGIAGGAPAPDAWGPPTLTFSSGLAGLSDGNPEDLRNQTVAFSSNLTRSQGDHSLSFGGDLDRLEFNGVSQPDPRGTFTFNGSATGNDFEDFLLGRADAVRLVYGDAGRHFRESTYDLFLDDDWHAGDSVTLQLGLRWEYEAPITELQGAMVNLDAAPGFTAVAPVLASHPVGSLTGRRYPDSLLRPDKLGLEPRLGVAWTPATLSSLVLRAGYGLYRDTSVYQSIASRMAEQAPLWQSLSVAATPAVPLTLATGLLTPAGPTPDLFGIAPDFRVGYVQTWNASAQRDLPGNMAITLTYLGNKGTRGVQQFLPNSYPPGGQNPCASCPAGFVYETSNGNSTLESGQVQIQRRYASGFAAMLTYTYAHALDDDGAGASNQSAGVLAQNWLDLDAERGNSSFDQRHKLTLTTQYSTGLALRGSGLMGGWRGTLLRGWTLTTQLTLGSGLPLTPTTPAVVGGTGFTGVRAERTGAALDAAPSGRYLNPAAFDAPPRGAWGNAGRNSITGPRQFGLDAGLLRSFPVRGHIIANLRLDATNVLNHVSYPSWDTVVGSAQFGLPLAANPMRSVRASFRLTF